MHNLYLLKNKDTVILSFKVAQKTEILGSLKKQQNYITEVEILNKDLLPYDFFADNFLSLEDNLKVWIKNRKIPKNREFMRELLATLGLEENDNLSYINYSLALSLNDSFWIIPANKNYLWKDYNLYQNPLNKNLALVAFLGNSTKITGLASSPEYTTNGILKKCWQKNEKTGKIELLKGQSQEFANRGKEAYCEFYMGQIAEVLGLDYVKYDLREFNNQIVSACELFCTELYGYLPINSLISKNIDKDNLSELFEAIIKIYGETNFKDLLLFDALIFNIDRHLGNFGMMVNNDTKELLKAAPIFDNGLSFFNFITKDELRDIEFYLKQNNYNHSALNLSFDELIIFAGEQRHIQGLKQLANFKFTKHNKFNLPDLWLNQGEKFIQNRAKKIIEIIKNKSPYG